MRVLGENGLALLAFLASWGYEHVLFYDWLGRMILSTTLQDVALLQQLHEYADGQGVAIHYYDVCVFHRDDSRTALAFIGSERQFRHEQSYR